jgi:SAM-dependent methyltransferase
MSSEGFLASAELPDYYRRRARQYESIYAKPERQADLSSLRESLCAALRGARVLEVACGTGYWTQAIAATARSIVATDLVEEPLRIAKGKRYPPGTVRFVTADAYALDADLGTFDAAFAGFWWSHVPRGRTAAFLDALHSRLPSGARVLLLDNLYVEGSSTPVCGWDAEGNSYQSRPLPDGSTVRVLKNFPNEAEMRERLARHAVAVRYEALQYYWLVEYRAR